MSIETLLDLTVKRFSELMHNKILPELIESLPKNLKGNLPTVEEIEADFEKQSFKSEEIVEKKVNKKSS
jgi:hypothetical protein